MAQPIRGLETKHEQRQQLLLRDTRPLTQRFFDFIRDPASAALILIVLAASCVLVPGANDMFFLSGIVIYLLCYLKHSTLPFRLPMRSHLPDYNDLKPGSGKPYQARGICFYGNDINTNEELWFNNEDMRTHTLIFGSTGSGKTETLVSLAYNALVQGSGFIYVDGKGDNSLFAKIFSISRQMGREDDVLLVNFMTGARDIVGPQPKRISNTMNPFSLGSSSMCAQLIISMMDSASASPDGDMWKGRAISFVEALMRILCYMRDRGDILLDANSIRQYFHLPKLESIVLDKKFPVDNDRSVSIEEAPDVVLDPITNYLLTLPGIYVFSRYLRSYFKNGFTRSRFS
jgi:intracellular multiplication protein IcmO